MKWATSTLTRAGAHIADAAVQVRVVVPVHELRRPVARSLQVIKTEADQLATEAIDACLQSSDDIVEAAGREAQAADWSAADLAE